MIKKIILLFGLIFVFIPFNFNSAFALTPDYRLELSDVTYSGSGLNNPENMFDNNTATSASLLGTVVISLKTPQILADIKSLGGDLSWAFYGENNNKLANYSIAAGAGWTSHYSSHLSGFKDVKISKIEIRNPSGNRTNIAELQLFVVNNDITNLELTPKKNTVELNFDLPVYKENYVGSNVYRDGVFIKNLDKTQTSYIDENLEFFTSYEYKVTALFNEIETTGLTKSIKTEKRKESLFLKNIDVKVTYNRVDLSWELPINEDLRNINIYRDVVDEQVSAASTKIFETNGTYFNDLTVKPETKYKYTFSISDVNGNETGYTDIEVETPAEPKPILRDPAIEENENGDYVFSWSEPTSGMVRIIVGGNEYQTVPAANSRITIPKNEMRYTPIGDPDVQAVPISESGLEGDISQPPSNLTNIELPFRISDLLVTSSGLLWWIAPFVLLSLSFLIVPKLRNLIANAVRGKRGEKELTETERRTKSESPEKEKIESLQMEKEPRESKKDRVEKQRKKLRSVRVRERQTKEPKDRRERALKEPKISISRGTRQPRQLSNRTREAREGRQSERAQRMPREPRRGR